MSFKFDASDLEKGLAMFEDKAMIAVEMFAETAAKKLEGEARKNAKWTDRTGDARKRLTGTVTKMGKVYRIKLAHGVDYGLWLELAHEKNFAIIKPTIDMMTPEVMRGLRKLLSR